MSDGKSAKDVLQGLYADLYKYTTTQDYEKALKASNKILNVAPGEREAFHSGVICLIKLKRFSDALDRIQEREKKFEGFAFERAYTLYRLNRPKEALEVISQERNNSEPRYGDLEAQILYSLERYEEALSVYKNLKLPEDDEFDMERRTNMSAARVHLGLSEKDKDPEESYELMYNQGCALISQSRWNGAIGYLKKALTACEQFFQAEDEDDLYEDDIDIETGIIKVQLAYVYQMIGKEKEAQQIYNEVLQTKPTDIGLIAVASNNLITLNKDQNIFDSRKRIKAATIEGLEFKLTSKQRRNISFNNILLAMYTNQMESCKSLIKEFDKNYSISVDEKDFILAAVLARSGDKSAAIKTILSGSSNNSLQRVLIASQLLLEKKDFEGTIRLLEKEVSEDVKFSCGVLSSMVTLHLALKDREGAATLLNKAVDYYSKKKGSKEMPTILKNAAEFHLQGGKPSVAARYLEELLEKSPGDKILLAQLVLAYATFDLNKALETSKKLPVFEKITLDVDALESSTFFGGSKKTPKPGGVASPEAKTLKTKPIKKRKNKKKKLPKNYDPNVEPDPERWLPRRERSTYKKQLKRDRRNKGGEKFTGAQGNALGQSENFDYSSKKATPKSPGSSQQTPQPSIGPRQQQRRHLQQKKKKKKGH